VHLQDNPQAEDHPLDHQEEVADHPQEDHQEDQHPRQPPRHYLTYPEYRTVHSKELCPPLSTVTEQKQTNLYENLVFIAL
jgi:hypothetical protein